MHPVICLIFTVVLASLPQDFASAQQSIPGEIPGVHNLVQLSVDIYSGSEPRGEEAFASLKHLGIQTIVSVDGAMPDIEMAKKHGIRYVHIPFGYDAIPRIAQLRLTRAARESRTPLYIHCHHGKHRGPAAAAIICRAKGLVDSSGALKILENAGTSLDYKGLWQNVEHYDIPSDDAELPQLMEVATVESLTSSMARIDRNFDHLKLLAAAEWKTPADHPDLVAMEEALQLQENLHEASRRLSESDHAAEYDSTFRTWLTGTNVVARNLVVSLRQNDKTAAIAAFSTLQKNCQQCHEKYRDQK